MVIRKYAHIRVCVYVSVIKMSLSKYKIYKRFEQKQWVVIVPILGDGFIYPNVKRVKLIN